MAAVELNPVSTGFSGRLGSLVFYQIRSKVYVRRYVVPRNPDTEKQKETRSLFAEAVRAWQSISVNEKNYYNRMASGRMNRGRGYNLFISKYMTGGGQTVLEKRALRQEKLTVCTFSSLHRACSFEATPLQVRCSFDETPLRIESVP